MSKRDDINLLWSCVLGKKSHLNLFGKIIMGPLAVLMCLEFTLLILLFQKP
jgi:hypothetical protein